MLIDGWGRQIILIGLDEKDALRDTYSRWDLKKWMEKTAELGWCFVCQPSRLEAKTLFKGLLGRPFLKWFLDSFWCLTIKTKKSSQSYALHYEWKILRIAWKLADDFKLPNIIVNQKLGDKTTTKNTDLLKVRLSQNE